MDDDRRLFVYIGLMEYSYRDFVRRNQAPPFYNKR